MLLLHCHKTVIKVLHNDLTKCNQRYDYHRLLVSLGSYMSRQILIIEDETPIREMLTFILDQNGFNAVEAQDYEQALSMIKEPYPDLILLDWMLPGGTGVQLAK